MKKASFGAALAMASSILVLGFQTFVAGGSHANAQTANAQIDNNIRAELSNHLKGSQFKDVKVSVKNGLVDLEGSVPTAAAKEQADMRAHRVKNVSAVRNNLQVAGAGEVSDAQLQSKLVKAIQYDRVGYWGSSPRIRDVTPFNAISVHVQNGVVTLGGTAYDPVSAESAVAVASNMHGVRDVIDDIEVAPVSLNDDHIRLQEFRAIYGFPTLNKYAIDPGKPIRISVVNGNVTLYGQVNSQADKDAAGIRAKGVPGVFGVTNNLQVAGKPAEK